MKEGQQVKLIDCPRDAIQGIKTFIDTDIKVAYLQKLLDLNFDTLDMGSFVSPKAIPQMRDTGEVIKALDLRDIKTKLLVIVANHRGARDAVLYDEITYLGFPFSISETFQQRNTNATREEAFERIASINELCVQHNKQLVIYFSMCFGNPYGDLWHPDIITYWAQRFSEIGINIIALSDTVGIGKPDIIGEAVSAMEREFDNIECGVHLHTAAHNWEEKVTAAFEAGCRRYDGAIRGYGGCPMAQDELIGNMPTENLLHYFRKKGLFAFEDETLQEVFKQSNTVFNH